MGIMYKDIKSGLSVIVQGSDGSIWKGLLLRKVENSYTKVVVMDIERGKGWDENTQKYVGYKVGNGWARGQNYDYGKEFELHIKNLSIK